jgi:hypothetical protein
VRDEAKQEAVAEMVALRAEGEPLRAIVAVTAERQSDQPRGRRGCHKGNAQINLDEASAVAAVFDVKRRTNETIEPA